ncbi:MAG: hypothetical protein IJD41_00720 [Alphaproteobacteria bacterium]|nr:hypothetical protein [Alphaproteobacteria bacterium]MBQ7128325.1 hypothetical protein [Alphaproteobacteria bacterium]
MKRIVFLFVCVPVMANAAAPITSCPSGYIAIDAPYITIATSCPSGTVSIGDAASCLVSSPSGDCIMYAPVGMSFTDDSGTYEYIEPCALQ